MRIVFTYCLTAHWGKPSVIMGQCSLCIEELCITELAELSLIFSQPPMSYGKLQYFAVLLSAVHAHGLNMSVAWYI